MVSSRCNHHRHIHHVHQDHSCRHRRSTIRRQTAAATPHRNMPTRHSPHHMSSPRINSPMPRIIPKTTTQPQTTTTTTSHHHIRVRHAPHDINARIRSIRIRSCCWGRNDHVCVVMREAHACACERGQAKERIKRMRGNTLIAMVTCACVMPFS